MPRTHSYEWRKHASRMQYQVVMSPTTTAMTEPASAAPRDVGAPPTMAGYPAQWERMAWTRDGIPFRIRPIRPDDLDRERTFLMNLSNTSRYNRLMSAVREPPPPLLYRFVHVDYRHTMAFVALIGDSQDEHIVGVARYGASAEDDVNCEFAVAVADEWQSRGIGTTLTRLLFEYARTQGFRRISGVILGSNERMLQLAHFVGMDTQRSRDDATLMEASVNL